jgi:hypothetical protein
MTYVIYDLVLAHCDWESIADVTSTYGFCMLCFVSEQADLHCILTDLV